MSDCKKTQRSQGKAKCFLLLEALYKRGRNREHYFKCLVGLQFQQDFRLFRALGKKVGGMGGGENIGELIDAVIISRY